MIDALVGALSGANAGLDLIKRAVAARDQGKIEAAVDEMVEKLRAANMATLQAAQEALQLSQDARAADQRIAELERQVQELQAKADERERYTLVSVGSNSFAYALKDPQASGQPPHYLCQACMDSGKKLVLQRHGASSVLKCPACATTIRSNELAAEVRARQGQVTQPRRSSYWSDY